MTSLEQEIIAIARQELAGVLAFYEKQAGDHVSEEDRTNYLIHHHALTTVLMLGHLHNSGMSLEARAALQQIEDESAAAFRASPN
ncbi:TPA: hypothetical protein ACYSE6_006600 [Pseudomonas aeruginosa]